VNTWEYTQTLLTSNEGLLVEQFQTFKQLVALTKEECQALFELDTLSLVSIVEKKRKFLESGEDLKNLYNGLNSLTDTQGPAERQARISMRLPNLS
jgi:flagellar biosynthesis/type III secretory pathway chaperone